MKIQMDRPRDVRDHRRSSVLYSLPISLRLRARAKNQHPRPARRPPRRRPAWAVPASRDLYTKIPSTSRGQ